MRGEGLVAAEGRIGAPLAGESALVVGGGFIGSHIASALANAGASVTVLTRSGLCPYRKTLTANCEVKFGDAADKRTVRRCLEGKTSVVYCAGGLLPADSDAAPKLDSRLTLWPLLNLLNGLRSWSGAELIYISSGGTVYGNPVRLPVDEEHPVDPISSYGRIRLECERSILKFSSQSGIPAQVLRCSNVYGPGQPADRAQGLVATSFSRLKTRQAIQVFGDGSNVRDFLFIEDLRYLVTALVGRRVTEVINVGSGNGTSILQLISLVEKVSGIRPMVETLPPRPFDVSSIVLNIDRLQTILPFEPTPLHTGLRKTWAQQKRSFPMTSYEIDPVRRHRPAVFGSL